MNCFPFVRLGCGSPARFALTHFAVRHGQHSAQGTEGAERLAEFRKHFHLAGAGAAGHQEHVAAAAEERRFLLQRNDLLRPERVQVVDLHHGSSSAQASDPKTQLSPAQPSPL